MVEIGPLSSQPLNEPHALSSAPKGEPPAKTFILKREDPQANVDAAQNLKHTFEFLEGLSHYYRVHGTTEQKTMISAHAHSVDKITKGLDEGKISPDQASKLLEELKSQPGFPNMDDPKTLQNRITGSLALLSQSHPELAQKINMVTQKLNAGAITPDEANIEINNINDQLR